MISIEEMRALEGQAAKKGLSRLMLMENAGKAVAEILQEKIDLKGKRVLVVCYHGNNGGDGFVAARHLSDKTEVDVLFIGDEEKLKEEAGINFERIHDNDMLQFISLEYVNFDDYAVIVDAMLGTGSRANLEYPLETVVDFINATKAFKVSVDIPTGLNPETGEISDKIINADLIIAFHDLKNGLEQFKEKTVVADIGL
jgi:NAD(P)H-hydrate epimerase